MQPYPSDHRHGDAAQVRQVSRDFDSSWLARHLARAAAKTPCPAEGVEVEAELHEDIRKECLRRGWLPFHGSMAHSTFRTEGEPDFVILRDGGRFLLVECKTRTGKLSTAQQAIAAWARRLGHRIHVVRSMKEFSQAADETPQADFEEDPIDLDG